MKFIYIFTEGSYISEPKNLFKLMSQKLDEYFGILSQIYLPDDGELRDAEVQKVKDNPNYQQILKAGWEIINSFNLISTLKKDEVYHSDILKKWINGVRELAKDNHRVKITDDCIGKLLAKYPINMKEAKGFPTEIYDMIEETDSVQIKNAFEVQISNNLGFTSRGAFSGGNIERARAKYFETLFEETKITHPNVALIFKRLTNEFLSQAKREDEDALLRSLE